VIAANLNWNPSELQNAISIGLSEVMKDMFMYTDMPEELPAFVTVCQKLDHLIHQHQAEKAAQNKGRGAGFASPVASVTSENSRDGLCGIYCGIYWTCTYGSPRRQKQDFGQEIGKEVSRWEVIVQ